MSVSWKETSKYRFKYYYRCGGNKKNSWTIRDITKSEADRFGYNLRLLISYNENSRKDEYPLEVRQWLDGLGPKILEELERRGLVKLAAARRPLVGYMTEYFERHGRNGMADSTRAIWNRAVKRVAEFFGPKFELNQLTSTDGERFEAHLLTLKGRTGPTWSRQTVAKMCGLFKQAVDAAVKEGLLPQNPLEFHGGTSAGANPERDRYIEVKDVLAVLNGLPSAEERLAIGLARFAGLRVPSELKHLKWSDLIRNKDGAIDGIKVRTPKTEKTGNHTKVVPVSEDLAVLLKEAEAVSASKNMFPNVRFPNRLLRTACKQTGTPAWPKLTHNLRASCLTDWVSEFDEVLAAQWGGITVQVLLRHYIRNVRAEVSAREASRKWRAGKNQSQTLSN